MIIHGNCLEVIKGLEEESIDAIVTDPPYELGFMGKKWDSTGIAYSVELWGECLRVLKPGGHLLAFSGTRTYHRMACAIEDAGFEIRDSLVWVYACCSEDTEILTKNGWERLSISNKSSIFENKEILIYDVENDVYKWEKPERWNVYNTQQDTLYRIKSDSTDQLVTRNHSCLVEREGKLVFIQADECSKMELVPYLSNDFCVIPKIQSSSLLKFLQWKSPFKILNRKIKDKSSKVDRGTETEIPNGNDGREKQVLERRSNLLQKERKVYTSINKICSLSERVYQYVKERWICNGAQIKSSNGDREAVAENRMCASHQSRCNRQQAGEFNVIQNKCRAQEVRTRASYNTTLATIEPFEYSGIVFCPTTSTGAFVARRNGKIFITGNSGFPKSTNIGKAYDKSQGNEREVVGEIRAGKTALGQNSGWNQHENKTVMEKTKGNSQWEGFGTALKPANEPICMARKPLSEKTIVENVLKHGTGALDIDGCRIPCNLQTEDLARTRQSGDSAIFGSAKKETNTESNDLGRFPANVLCTDDALNDGVVTKSGHLKKGHKRGLGTGNTWKMNGGEIVTGNYGNDSGSKSRYFDIDVWAEKHGILQFPKASKSDRGSGNTHPTVKPVHLMAWLVRLVSKDGDTVLDPFAGSGTTGVACSKLGRKYVLIEQNEEYIDIIKSRIDGGTLF